MWLRSRQRQKARFHVPPSKMYYPQQAYYWILEKMNRMKFKAIPKKEENIEEAKLAKKILDLYYDKVVTCHRRGIPFKFKKKR